MTSLNYHFPKSLCSFSHFDILISFLLFGRFPVYFLSHFTEDSSCSLLKSDKNLNIINIFLSKHNCLFSSQNYFSFFVLFCFILTRNFLCYIRCFRVIGLQRKCRIVSKKLSENYLIFPELKLQKISKVSLLSFSRSQSVKTFRIQFTKTS